MNLISRILSAIKNRKSRNVSASVSDEDLRKQMRTIQEMKKQEKPNFGNAGGLNSPTDFMRGFGGKAVNDHLTRPPKDNP
jgi:hypothetical protein